MESFFGVLAFLLAVVVSLLGALQFFPAVLVFLLGALVFLLGTLVPLLAVFFLLFWCLSFGGLLSLLDVLVSFLFS